MPAFYFRHSHRGLEGKVRARDQKQVEDFFKHMGLGQVEVEPWTGFSWRRPRGKRGEVSNLLSHLALAFRNGVSLPEVLHGVESGHYSPPVVGLAQLLGHSLEAGFSFSDSVARFPHEFPRFVRGILATSQETGQLAEALERCAEMMKKREDMFQRLRSSLTYPLFTCLTFVLVMVAFIFYIVPVFTGVFLSFGVTPPWTLRVITWLSHGLEDAWTMFFAFQGLVVVGMWAWSSLRSTAFQKRLLSIAQELPLVGSVLKDYLVTQFCILMQEMLGVGVDLRSALEMARESLPPGRIQLALGVALEEVTHGQSLAEALASGGFFPPLVVSMVAAGEESGRLVLVFKKLVVYHEQSYEYQVERFLTLIEPLMIGFMGLVVAGFVLSLVGPMFNLFQVVGL